MLLPATALANALMGSQTQMSASMHPKSGGIHMHLGSRSQKCMKVWLEEILIYIYIYTDTEMLKTTGFVVPSSCQGNAVRASE